MVDTSIRYQRIRVPREHQTTLQIPEASQLESWWHRNLESQQAQSQASLGSYGKLESWRQAARQELFALARKHSASYLTAEQLDRLPSLHDSVLMSGHQPSLFHPGVWYKNFCLSSFAKRLNSTPVNLVVDSDLAGRSAISVPMAAPSTGAIQLGSVPFDAPFATVPFERRPVVESKHLAEFSNEISQYMEAYNGTRNLIGRSLAKEMHAVQQRHPQASLGFLLAAGRHRLEVDSGLATWELPVSQLAQSTSFAQFVALIVAGADDFIVQYNEVLNEYRKVHRIRSRSHPVPELERREIDGVMWRELPFWIWSHDKPMRRALYVRSNEERFVISDLQGLQRSIPRSDCITSLASLESESISLRPRALMTTMFSRLLISDMFLHGIGGAKYDQLTDALAERFFNIQLPAYATLSASYLLPTDREIVRPEDVRVLKSQIRNQKFHPEKHIRAGDPTAEILVKEKQQLIQRIKQTGSSKSLHDQIVAVNQKLQQCLAVPQDQLGSELRRRKEALIEGQLTGSREFSFCLFEPDLIDWLNRASQSP